MTTATLGKVIRTLERAQPTWRETTLAKVQRESHDPFRILISCVLSLRTKDEITDEASTRLFRLAHTPKTLLRLSVLRIAKTIYPVGFYRTKARAIRDICRRLIRQHAGNVPDTLEELLVLPGVGRKTANLVITLGFGKPGICVDVHVHRICNRWGLVQTKTPNDTEMALRAVLPQQYWISYNDLLVSFGQTLCRPTSPWCSCCPIAYHCPQRGVTSQR